MPYPYVYQNRNVCKTFNLAVTTALKGLTSQECSEVIVFCTVSTTFFDHMNPTVGFTLPANTEFTFRGLSNSNQLSAQGTTTGTLYYRTQYFGSIPGV